VCDGKGGGALAVLAMESPLNIAIHGDPVGLGLNAAVTLPSKEVTGMVPLYPYLSGIEGSKTSVYTSCVT